MFKNRSGRVKGQRSSKQKAAAKGAPRAQASPPVANGTAPQSAAATNAAEPTTERPPEEIAVNEIDDDEETYIQSNVPNAKPRKASEQTMRLRLFELEIEVARTRKLLSDERNSKHQLYNSLVKLAVELKRMRAESMPLMNAADYAKQTWYEGGLWRAPKALPSVGQERQNALLRQPLGLTDLFVTVVVVIALTRIERAIVEIGWPTVDTLLYFVLFWTIWIKDLNYKTRFDSTDLSIQAVNILTAMAVLYGSLSVTSPLRSADGTRLMQVGGFVALLHLIVHFRLWLCHIQAKAGTVERSARNYALFRVILTFLETVAWAVGIFVLPQDFSYRWIVFVVAFGLSPMLPGIFLGNDFNAESTKRGVFFVILVCLFLHDIVFAVDDYFLKEDPSGWTCLYIGAIALLLFGMTLMYVDDFPTLAQDHALLMNRTSAFFYHKGQFLLVLFTAVMGTGLVLLTRSYVAQQQQQQQQQQDHVVSNMIKQLVCWGFAATTVATFFIKSLHLQRIPSATRPKVLFFVTYAMQTIVMIAVVAVAVLFPFWSRHPSFGGHEEVDIVGALCILEWALLLVSWVDEILEMALFHNGEDSQQNMVEPFGMWWFMKGDKIETPKAEDLISEQAVSEKTALLGGKTKNKGKYDGSKIVPIV